MTNRMVLGEVNMQKKITKGDAITTKNEMKNYEVCFINPMCPSEPVRWIVKAMDEHSAVCEANFSFFNHIMNEDYFLVKETDKREYKTAENWGTVYGWDLVDAPVGGYKIVKLRLRRTA